MPEINVEQHQFRPHVEPEGKGPEDPEGATQPAPDGATAVEGELCWSPEQAEAVLSALWNMGCLFYGFEWAAQQGEFAGWSDAAAHLLDRYVPFGAGEGSSLVLDVIRCAGGVSLLAIRRRELIKRGPVILGGGKKQPTQQWAPQQQQPAANGAPAPPPAAEEPTVAAAPPSDQGAAVFQFRPEDVEVIARTSKTRDDSYAGLGYDWAS